MVVEVMHHLTAYNVLHDFRTRERYGSVIVRFAATAFFEYH